MKLTDPQISDIPLKSLPDDLAHLVSSDKELYLFLLNYSDGVSRSFLYKSLNLARTTIYDSLIRLEIKQIVSHKSIKRHSRGRPVIHYLARPIPNG